MSQSLKDDLTAQEYVINNAYSKEAFYALAKMKMEDNERRRKLDAMQTDLGHVVGAGLGILLDPLNFIPLVGQEALVLKGLARLGSTTVAKLGVNKLAQIAEIGVTNGLVNILDQKLNEEYGGVKSNPALAFALGAGAGAGITYLRSFRALNGMKATDAFGKNLAKVERQIDKISDRSLMTAMDMDTRRYMTARPLSPLELTTRKQTRAEEEALGAITVEPIKEAVNVTKARKLMANSKNQEAINKLLKEETPQVKPTKTPEQIELETAQDKAIARQEGKQVADEDIIYRDTKTNETVINGVPFGDEALTPRIVKEASEMDIAGTKAIEDETPLVHNTKSEVADITQVGGLVGKTKVGRRLAYMIETSPIFRGAGEIVRTSIVPTVREFANEFVVDKRGRLLNSGTPITMSSNLLMKDFNGHIDRVTKAFAKYARERGLVFSHLPTQKLKEEYCDLLSKAYHDKHIYGRDISGYIS